MLALFGYGASLFIGVALGLLGGGGAILTVPVLRYLFGMDAALATVSSLVVVGATSAAAAVGAALKKELAFVEGVLFALPGFVSVMLVRKFLVPMIPESFEVFGFSLTRSFLLMSLFAVVMYASGFAMLRRSSSDLGTKPKANENGAESSTDKIAAAHGVAENVLTGIKTPRGKTGRILAQGFFVGGLTGLVGAGGGFLIVPAMSLLVGLPMRTAVGTSLFVIALNSLVGVVASLQTGVSFPWQLLGGVLALSLVGMLLGRRLGRYVSGPTLKKGFAWFVLVMATFIFTRELIWLFKH